MKHASTREAILAEHELLKAGGAFERAGSLLGRYARPELQLEYDELEATLHEAATEWEKEIDGFFSDE